MNLWSWREWCPMATEVFIHKGEALQLAQLALSKRLIGGMAKLAGVDAQEQDRTVSKGWNVSVANLTITLAQLAFLAYIAGQTTERLEQVTTRLTSHLAEVQAVNADARLTVLERELAQERADRQVMKNEIVSELRELSQKLDKMNGR